MLTTSRLSDLPERPAVYAMHAGSARPYVAYVGIADRLRARLEQHFVRRDSSVVTRAAAVSLNPDLITEVAWWEDDSFTVREYLEPAELVAFERLAPVLRSRGVVGSAARLLLTDSAIRTQLDGLVTGAPSGRLLRSGLEAALTRISELEARVARLEATQEEDCSKGS